MVIHFIHQIHQSRALRRPCADRRLQLGAFECCGIRGLAVDVAVAMTKPHQHWLVTIHQIGHSIDSVISAPVPERACSVDSGRGFCKIGVEKVS